MRAAEIGKTAGLRYVYAGTCQAWSATGKTRVAELPVIAHRTPRLFDQRLLLTPQGCCHLVPPAFPEVGPCVSATDYRSSFVRSCAPNQIFWCSTSKKPRSFPGSRFRQFVEIVNEPGCLSGLVGRMTIVRLDRLDGSTSHPWCILGLRDRIPFLSYESKTDLHLRHRKLSVPNGGHMASLGSESYPSRQASEGKKSKRFTA